MCTEPTKIGSQEPDPLTERRPHDRHWRRLLALRDPIQELVRFGPVCDGEGDKDLVQFAARAVVMEMQYRQKHGLDAGTPDPSQFEALDPEARRRVPPETIRLMLWVQAAREEPIIRQLATDRALVDQAVASWTAGKYAQAVLRVLLVMQAEIELYVEHPDELTDKEYGPSAWSWPAD